MLTIFSAVEAATRQIASVATTSKIIIEKSTVPCLTAHSIRLVLEANKKPGVEFDILSNPEFLAEILSLFCSLLMSRVGHSRPYLPGLRSHWLSRDSQR
jgi:UDP-glucose 6-dehydrogenase